MSTTFEAELTGFLLAQTPITAAASGGVFKFRKNQGAGFPNLTWTSVSSKRFKDMDGPVGITAERVRFDCRGLTFADADTLAAAVRGLDGYQGTMVTIRCQAFLVDDAGNGEDEADDPVSGEEAGTAMKSIFATITYEEPS